ncbi:MAG: LytTR family DNA-binding domain-containing protein [Mariniphaga sp.]
MINAVIIEDDPAFGKHLELLIQEFCPDIHLVALLVSGHMALEMLPFLKYDLIFSDIGLGDMNAFELFEKLDKPNQHIIFTTSHNEFAFNAFKLDAIDYLEKPITPDDLIRSVNKVYDRILEKDQSVFHKDNLDNHKGGRILYRADNQLRVISHERIIYCEAHGSYTKVYLDDGSNPKLLPTHLKKIEETLSPVKFFRIHNTHIINCDFFDHILYNEKICVLKNHGSAQKIQLKISDRKYQPFMDFIKTS